MGLYRRLQDAGSDAVGEAEVSAYEVPCLAPRKDGPAHLCLHPFGLIPTPEDADLALFETGAITLYIAEHHEGLFKRQRTRASRARPRPPSGGRSNAVMTMVIGLLVFD
jgi:Glutathione S-transferase, N-terminal domain